MIHDNERVGLTTFNIKLIGGVAIFVNADAGDIDPTSATCDGMPNYDGAPIIAQAVKV